MTLSLTLADYAAQPQTLVAGVAKVLRENSRVMDLLTFQDLATLSVEVYREAGMADAVAWRQIGANHGSVKAPNPKRIEEMAYSIGNEISVDKVFMKDTRPRLINPMTYQTEMIVKGIARGFTDKLFNGLPTDLSNPVGLWYRIMNDLPTTQRITADPAGSTAGLDISYDASGLGTNTQAFFDKLDALLYAVNDSVDAEGKGVYLFMNDTTLMRFQSIFRQSEMLQTTQDAVGRVFSSYKGAMMVDVGYKSDETDVSAGTRIIGNVETLAGTALTGGTGTSIYAAKLGPTALTAWQEYALDVSEPVLDPVHQVTYTSVIDWVVGIALVTPRCVARLYGVVAA